MMLRNVPILGFVRHVFPEYAALLPSYVYDGIFAAVSAFQIAHHR